MSNIQKEICKNKIDKIFTRDFLLKFDIETRIIYAFKNPDAELEKFDVIQSKNYEIIEELKERKLKRAFDELDCRDKKEITESNYNIDKIENFIKNKVKNIFKRYFEEEISKELKDKSKELKKKLFEEKLNDFVSQIDFESFILKKSSFLINNLNKIIEKLNGNQKEIFLNLPEQKLLALAKIHKNLELLIQKLNKENLIEKFFNLECNSIEALAKIENLSSVLYSLDTKDLIEKFFDFECNSIETLANINDLGNVMNQEKDKTFFLNLVKENTKAIEALAKIENLSSIMYLLKRNDLVSNFLNLAKENIKVIETLAKIRNLVDVVKELNKKNLTLKFLELSIETLQNPELIKQALEIDFEITIKTDTDGQQSLILDSVASIINTNYKPIC